MTSVKLTTSKEIQSPSGTNWVITAILNPPLKSICVFAPTREEAILLMHDWLSAGLFEYELEENYELL